MNIAVLLQQAIGGIVPNGLWPGKASEDIAAPYAIFMHFGSTDFYLNGRAPLQNQRVQIDIWANTYDECSTYADQVETAMDTNRFDASPSTFTATQLSRQFFPPEAETHLQRIMLEFSMWYQP